MVPYGKSDSMLVHRESPLNAETAADALAEHALTPVDRFYVRNHGEVPAGAEDWELRIDGLVEQPLMLTVAALRERHPAHELTATLQCAGNRRNGLLAVADIPGQEPWGPGATGTAVWRGARLADVLAAAAPRVGAAHVGFAAEDLAPDARPPQPYGASIPLGKALGGEVLLAWEMNGEPLPAVHGGPVRVVVPGYIGARSVKWLRRIELRASAWEGWFQHVMYRLIEPGQKPAPLRGIPLGELGLTADFLTPADGAAVAAGRVEAGGYALVGGERHIARVDVSADDGATWSQAELREDLGRWAWRRWRATLDLAPGRHALRVRAWDSAGTTQPEDPRTVWNPQGYMNTAQGRAVVDAA